MYKLFDVHIARRIELCADLYNVCITPASYGATYRIWFRLPIPNQRDLKLKGSVKEPNKRH